MKKISSFIALVVFLLTSCSPTQPASTQTPSPTSTFTPQPTTTVTPTATITPTATPVPFSLVFEEDFVSDVLGWKSIYRGETFLSYDGNGLDLRTPGGWPWYWMRPPNIMETDGDFDFEVVFDRRVKLSGVWFANETLDWSDWFVVAINQGAFSEQNWEHEKATLGVLTLSQPRTFGDWRQLGNRNIEELINEQNGQIHLQISFRGSNMNVMVNGTPFVSDKKNFYAGKKYFMGFLTGDKDRFIVKDLRVFAVEESFEIVNSVEMAWQEAAPTFEAMVSMTPISLTSTATPVLRTPSGSLTIDDFVGNWKNVDSGTSGTTRISIAKEDNKIIYHSWGRCHPSDCDHGITTTIFEGSPIILFRDAGFAIDKLVISREGNLLHVIEFIHFIDYSGRPDRIAEYYFRR